MTFTIVLMTWVFFRARDLPHAFRYLGDMFALGTPQDGAALLSGIVYQPYYLGTFLLAGTIVWSAPQTWEWTRTLTPAKATAVVASAGAVGAGSGDAGIQPLHLFHFLMATPILFRPAALLARRLRKSKWVKPP